MATPGTATTPTHPKTGRRFWEQVTKLILHRTRFGAEIIIGLWALGAIDWQLSTRWSADVSLPTRNGVGEDSELLSTALIRVRTV